MGRINFKSPSRFGTLIGGSQLQASPSTPPPSPINRMICTGIAMASWVMVATPLYVTAAMQDGPVVQPPIVRTHHEIARQSWDPLPPIPGIPRRAIPTQQIDNPPPSSDVNFTTILKSWDPPQLPYQPPRYAIPTQQIDSPPPSSDINLNTILHSWDPPPVVVLQSVRSIPTQEIDLPPPSSSVNDLIIMRTWDPPVVSPIWLTAGVQNGPTITTPDNPPVNSRPWMASVVASWDATNPIRPRAPVVTASGPDVLIPNPPFTRPWLDTVLHSWDEQNPVRPRQPVVTSSGPVVTAPNPPFGRPWLSTVLTSWEPLPPQPVWSWRLIDLTVYAQPQQSWDSFYVILASWTQPPEPRQRMPVLLASGPDVIIPNPPFTRPWLDPVLHSWDESNPIRPRAPVVTPSGPTFQAPYTRPWLDIILHSWDPSAPILYRSPTVTPSGPDVVYPNPAFTRPWVDVIQHSWDEQNPIRPRSPIVTPSGPDVPQPPDVTGGATGRRSPGGKKSDYKAWPLPPPQFPLEQQTEVMTLTTDLTPKWLKAGATKTKNRGTYRGLVYRPPVEPEKPAPIKVKAPVVKEEPAPTIYPAVDTTSAQQALAKRRRQEEEFIISFLMQHVL